MISCETYVLFGDPVVTYCDVESGWPGEGNIDTAPLFANASNDDYHLLPGSPCIDAADNTAVPADTYDLDGDSNTSEPIPFDLDGNPRFVDDPRVTDTGNGTAPIVDMGAYEGPAYLSGDLNCDGLVNGFDINRFIQALDNWNAYLEDHDGDPYPPCDPWLADCNGDGSVNGFDIDAFVDLLN